MTIFFQVERTAYRPNWKFFLLQVYMHRNISSWNNVGGKTLIHSQWLLAAAQRITEPQRTTTNCFTLLNCSCKVDHGQRRFMQPSNIGEIHIHQIVCSWQIAHGRNDGCTHLEVGFSGIKTHNLRAALDSMFDQSTKYHLAKIPSTTLGDTAIPTHSTVQGLQHQRWTASWNICLSYRYAFLIYLPL